MKAFGTFTKIGDMIYRTDTYLQFGDSHELLGACVLCNPGSAELENKEKMEKLINSNDVNRHVETGELRIDPTMKQLIDILEGIYGKGLKGIFRIYNLFTLRNANMDDAIKCIRNDNVDKTMLYKDLEDFKNMGLEDKLVLKAWGVKKDEFLNELKERWIKLIRNKEVLQLGKLKEKSQYYHPLPLLVKYRKKYVEYIINQYKEKVQGLQGVTP